MSGFEITITKTSAPSICLPTNWLYVTKARKSSYIKILFLIITLSWVIFLQKEKKTNYNCLMYQKARRNYIARGHRPTNRPSLSPRRFLLTPTLSCLFLWFLPQSWWWVWSSDDSFLFCDILLIYEVIMSLIDENLEFKISFKPSWVTTALGSRLGVATGAEVVVVTTEEDVTMLVSSSIISPIFAFAVLLVVVKMEVLVATAVLVDVTTIAGLDSRAVRLVPMACLII